MVCTARSNRSSFVSPLHSATPLGIASSAENVRVVAGERGVAEIADVATRADEPGPLRKLKALTLAVVPAEVDDAAVAASRLAGVGKPARGRSASSHGVDDEIGRTVVVEAVDGGGPSNLDRRFRHHSPSKRPLDERPPHGEILQILIIGLARSAQLASRVDVTGAGDEERPVYVGQLLPQLEPAAWDQEVRL